MFKLNLQKLKIILCLTIFLFIGNTIANVQDIVIQDDYWTGTKCLENGVPWQVPGSIYKEAENCDKNDIALEIGTGGSTIFLAKRCKKVIAIETDPEWAARVQNKLIEENLTNVEYHCITQQKLIEKFLKYFLPLDEITIFSVDSIHGYNRSAFANAFLTKGMADGLKMIVMDNYGAPELFPEHYNTELMDSDEWKIFIYDDGYWCGKGTKLYIRSR